MRIPRLHLFELEDQPWFPATIRDLATDCMHFIEARFGMHQPAVSLVAEMLRMSRVMSIVDLCSGGSGPMPALLSDLATQGVSPDVILTDRFPNLEAFERVAADSNGRISFSAKPVDARAVPHELRGLRTLFNSFHHFPPGEAVAVLRDAAQAGQPIAIFEIPDRRLRTLISVLLLTPLLVALVTPFMRPFRWRRLFWTYVFPLVPITCWWDGLVSQLRAYSPEELQRLAETASADTYGWRAGQVRIGSPPGYLTYLMGYPNDQTGSDLTASNPH